MHHITRSEVVPYSASDMFSLVADVDRYKEFLPWCVGSRILGREKSDILAVIEVGQGPVRTSFTTRARARHNARLDIQLVDGPLKALEGSWRFEDLSEGGSRVILDLRFETDGSLPLFLTESLLKHVTGRIVSAFKKRAASLYRP